MGGVDIQHLSAAPGPAASAPGGTALAATEAPFGPGCAAVPGDPADEGSFAALAQEPPAAVNCPSSRPNSGTPAARRGHRNRRRSTTPIASRLESRHGRQAGHRTLEGSALTVIGSGHELRVDGTAPIVCGDVYFVDAALIPHR